MRIGFVLFVALVLLIAACGQTPTAPQDVKNAPPATLPPPPPPPAPAEKTTPTSEPEATILNDSANVFAGEKSLPVDGGLKAISCDAEARRLTFTIVNQDDKTWSLDQEVGFSGSQDTVNLKVFINKEEANSKSPRYADGERLFGPEHPFSENCGGVTMLAPGEEVTCTLEPVPLKEADAFANKNRMWLSIPGGNIKYVSFTCE